MGYHQRILSKTAWLTQHVPTQVSHSNVQLTLDRQYRSLETGSAWDLLAIRSANILHPPQWRLGGWRTLKIMFCVNQCVSFINLQVKFITYLHKMQYKNEKISEKFLRIIYFHLEYIPTITHSWLVMIPAPKVCHPEYIPTQHTNVAFKLEYSTRSRLHNLDQSDIPAVWVTTNGYCQRQLD